MIISLLAIDEQEVIVLKKNGRCEDFGHSSILNLNECKSAARTIGKLFHRNIKRKRRLPRGCLVYTHKAFYNEPIGHPHQKKRSKRSSKRKRTAKGMRRRKVKPHHICYEKKGN